MDCAELSFSAHALTRMFEHAIDPQAVRTVIDCGETIEDYPDDKPFPSGLLLGTVAERILHVVAARDMATGKCYVITVYPPDSARWDSDFRKRRKR